MGQMDTGRSASQKTLNSQPQEATETPQYRLLVGFDFSDHAERALEHALALASGRANVQLHVLWSLRAEELPSGELTQEATDNYQRRLLGHITSKLANAESQGYDFRGLETVVHVTEKAPKAALVDAAYLEGAHLVLVGTRDLGGVKGLVLGSVAEGVVKEAQCPVMVCRERAASAVPKIEPAPAPGQESSLGRRHVYHQRDRSAASNHNLPLFFSM